jgi:hypothetical protein
MTSDNAALRLFACFDFDRLGYAQFGADLVSGHCPWSEIVHFLYKSRHQILSTLLELLSFSPLGSGKTKRK